MRGIIAKVWAEKDTCKLTLTQTKHLLMRHLLARAKRPPDRRTNYIIMLLGEPGIGKSTMLMRLGKEMGWGQSELLHLNTAAFEDFTGLPIVVDREVDGEIHKVATFAKANFVPGAVFKPHHRIGVLDELPTAPPNVQCILREMIDGRLNGERLDPKCMHIATGNPPEARFTTVNAVDEAIEDRIVPYVVVPTGDELLQIWSRIMDDLVYQFLVANATVIEDTISPRRWMTVAEQVQDLVEAGESPDMISMALRGVFAEQRDVLIQLQAFIAHGNDPLKLPILARNLVRADEEAMAGYIARMEHWAKNNGRGFIGHSKNDLVRLLLTMTKEERDEIGETAAANVAIFVKLLVDNSCIDMASNMLETIYSGTLTDEIMAHLETTGVVDTLAKKYERFKRDVDSGAKASKRKPRAVKS